MPWPRPWYEIFECIDPFGYLREVSQPVTVVPVQEAFRVRQENWSEDSTREHVRP
ncbi:MAG TPA: hypothetical protein VLJ88_18445 [Propionibacteriaceae bacterium]|nr:hypothetical protein [Propionibacteriaceae bacterium]